MSEQKKVITTYRDLDVWQMSMTLAVDIYTTTRDFPRNEVYGLMSQVRRAAASIPANIAEGHARRSRKEYRRFLEISRGSLAELETHLLLCQRLELVSADQVDSLWETLQRIGRMLNGLIGALCRKPS